MLLLGVLAAQAEGAVAAAGSYDLLETEILTTTTASVTFSDLNSTYGADYQHLQIRFTGRSNKSGDNDNFQIRINGDSGSNYSAHRLQADGSSFTTSGYSNQTIMYNAGVLPAATSTANAFAGAVVDILDPFETTKYTTARSFSGSTSKTLVALTSGLWMNTAAVTSIELDVLTGNWITGSRFSLYGLRSA